jgi:tRNA-specific 2-thiouridylase
MKERSNKKVVVAMSGGVDSSVAAYLLKKEGFAVIGVFLHFWRPNYFNKSKRENLCCTLESLNRAREVARRLNIPFYALNFKVPFKKLVVDNFLENLKEGNTPNPCILCNRLIKFDLLQKKAAAIFKTRYIATGHYAIIKGPKSVLELHRGRDQTKDQSYFLYALKQSQLKNILFPIGNYTKKDVFNLAKKLKFPLAEKESQEICFAANDLNAFIRRYIGNQPGVIKNSEKNSIMGKHQGLSSYTIGQRSGIGLSGGPFYVVKKDKKKNILWVTSYAKNPKLFKKRIFVDKVNWISKKPKLPLNCQVKIRYQQEGSTAKIRQYKEKLKIIFEKPQRAATSGQSAVFYQNEKVLGGGVIID